jgi:hypothetical protein
LSFALWGPILVGAALRGFKREAGINGAPPTTWAPPIYSVLRLSPLRSAPGGNEGLRLAAVRSYLAAAAPRKPNATPKKSEKNSSAA